MAYSPSTIWPYLTGNQRGSLAVLQIWGCTQYYDGKEQVGETLSMCVCKPDPILLTLSQRSPSYSHFWQDISMKIWSQQRGRFWDSSHAQVIPIREMIDTPYIGLLMQVSKNTLLKQRVCFDTYLKLLIRPLCNLLPLWEGEKRLEYFNTLCIKLPFREFPRGS